MSSEKDRNVTRVVDHEQCPVIRICCSTCSHERCVGAHHNVLPGPYCGCDDEYIANPARTLCNKYNPKKNVPGYVIFEWRKERKVLENGKAD